MKYLGFGAAVLTIVVAGCGSASHQAETAAISTPRYAHPEHVDGLPVHYLAWTARLPGIDGRSWQSTRPGSFRITPQAAISRALSDAFMRRHTQVIYVQTAGVLGGRTGNPRSAYIVETIGHYGFHGAGPIQPQPPIESFAVMLVNGRTGQSELLMSGQEHGVVRDGKAMLTRIRIISQDGFWLAVPASWSLGKDVKIDATSGTDLGAGDLLPKMLADRGPGISADPRNQSPFFSEQMSVDGRKADLQVGELGADGHYYTLAITVGASGLPNLREAADSLQTPPIANATDDVHLIQRYDQSAGLALTIAQVGGADRWILVSGNVATAQEQYALFGSTDGGSRWTLLHWTPQANSPGLAGEPTMLFWSASDGLLVLSTAFLSHLQIYRTTNGGATFIYSALPVAGEPSGAAVLARSPRGVLTVTVPLTSGTFSASSADNGQTWLPTR